MPVRPLKSSFIKPQLAQLVSKPPTGEQWIHEIKLDGYRTLTYLKNKKSKFFTRNGHDWSDKYQSLAGPLSKLNCKSAILDGEICVTDDEGCTNFQSLQAELGNDVPSNLTYYIFDLLELNGHDTRRLPLRDRKELLKILLKKSDKRIRYNPDFADGIRLLEDARKQGLEGIVSKNSQAVYNSGRTTSWIKTKCHLEQEFIIIGYSLSEKRGGFKSLLLGVYDKRGTGRKLKYAGRVGTGFKQAELTKLSKVFQKLAVEECPLDYEIELGNRWRKADDVQWIKPKLLAQVEFTGWTADEQLRHPSFKGLREDKSATDVIREKPASAKS